MNTLNKTNFQWKNKTNLKLHTYCEHISKKPSNKLEFKTLTTKQNEDKALRDKNQKLETFTKCSQKSKAQRWWTYTKCSSLSKQETKLNKRVENT